MHKLNTKEVTHTGGHTDAFEKRAPHTHTRLELSPLVVGLGYKAFVVELILRFDVLLLSQLTKLPPRSKTQSTEITIKTPSYICAWERSL